MSEEKDFGDTPEIDFPISRDNGLAKKVYSKSKPFFRTFNAVMGLVILSSVFLFAYPDPFQVTNPPQNTMTQGLDKKTVMLPRNQHQIIFDNFENFTEQGYCLYGEINQTHIKIKQLIHNNNPVSSGSQHVMNLCRHSMIKQLPKMYLDYSYKFLGTVHTHPISDNPVMSSADKFAFGQRSIFINVMGVASNETVNFYTEDSLNNGVAVKYY